MLDRSNIQLSMKLLRSLDAHWPELSEMAPSLLHQIEHISTSLFVRAMQSLSDGGLISYELFLTGAHADTVYRGTAITAKGRAYLSDNAQSSALVLSA